MLHNLTFIKKCYEIGTYYCFSHDILTMYDGSLETSPIIGEYCDSTPPTIITTRNDILLHFVTSPIYTEIGFKMTYNPTSNTH